MAFEWVKPGAKCVCIDAHGWAFRHEANLNRSQLPHQGGVYIVREVCKQKNGVVGVKLEGLDNSHIPTDSGEEINFRINRFRPITTKTLEQDMEVFNHLLNPTPLERLDRLAELLGLGY